MANFQEVLTEAMKRGKCKLASINQNVMEVAKATKKKPAFIKVAVTDETAINYFGIKQKDAGFIIHVDGDFLQQLSDEIDLKNSKGVEENAS